MTALTQTVSWDGAHCAPAGPAPLKVQVAGSPGFIMQQILLKCSGWLKTGMIMLFSAARRGNMSFKKIAIYRSCCINWSNLKINQRRES